MNQEVAQQRKLLEAANENPKESNAKNDKKGFFSKKNKSQKWTLIFMTSTFPCKLLSVQTFYNSFYGFRIKNYLFCFNTLVLHNVGVHRIIWMHFIFFQSKWLFSDISHRLWLIRYDSYLEWLMWHYFYRELTCYSPRHLYILLEVSLFLWNSWQSKK